MTVFGDGTQSRCFGWVGDVVDALIALTEHPDAVGKVFNIGHNQEVTIRELAERVISLTHSRSSIRMIPYDQAYELVSRICIDASRALSAFKSLSDISPRKRWIKYWKRSSEVNRKKPRGGRLWFPSLRLGWPTETCLDTSGVRRALQSLARLLLPQKTALTNSARF